MAFHEHCLEITNPIYTTESLLLRVIMLAAGKVESEVHHGASYKDTYRNINIILHLSLQL